MLDDVPYIIPYYAQVREAWRTYMPLRGDTENHWVMYYTTLYLMAQLWPGEPGDRMVGVLGETVRVLASGDGRGGAGGRVGEQHLRELMGQHAEHVRHRIALEERVPVDFPLADVEEVDPHRRPRHGGRRPPERRRQEPARPRW